MAATVVIPARFGSTRFPAKILAADTGMPLVQHVVERVRACARVRQVIVATDDERIVAALRPFGTRCVMTDPGHPSGTDRVAEVAAGLSDEIIINVQGDEPEIDPGVIDTLAYLMEDEAGSPGAYEMWTAATLFKPPADPGNPNLVKVAFTRASRAMYFSRSKIPFCRDPSSSAQPAYYLHVGIYAYRRDTLLRLAGWKPTPCEVAEKLEQLRALEHDVPIGITVIDHPTNGIDTPEQYAEFVGRFKRRRS
ncbi:MAG TPA: 3-deoxy-manno-octulosonate cytidylyltransferase [Tepidisphaeraceae bacterium]|nr:3-deoxy-manno-octulosonate cytidylyltransferase [Tepidisphaeraceae bacterium]